MESHIHIIDAWQDVQKRLAAAAVRAGRDPGSIRTVAVSKKQPAEAMNTLSAWLEKNGNSVIFGESYLQEFKAKKEALSGNCEVHMVGPLQSNKAKEAVTLFDCIESIHTLKIAHEINKAASTIGKKQNIFIQVNISRDTAKSGFMPEDLPAVLREIDASCGSLAVQGLMTITRLYEKPEESRRDFKAMRELAEGLNRQLELSMGMSDDFEVAVEEGATVVRVGTAIFGER